MKKKELELKENKIKWLKEEYLKEKNKTQKDIIFEEILKIQKEIKTTIERNSKNKEVKRIYEEILPIDDNVFFITTLLYTDESIAEEVIYFANNEKNELETIKQRKNYQNITEYKNDYVLIENRLNTTKCITIGIQPVKEYLLGLEIKKIQPSEKALNFYILSWVIVPIFFSVPFAFPITLVVKALISGAILLTRVGTSIFSSVAKKIESWLSNKVQISDDIKKNVNESITNLKNKKLETKLSTQFSILNDELNTRKNKYLIEKLNIDEINNIDLHKPSTNTRLYHSHI